MTANKLDAADQALQSYNQACDDFAKGKITLDELMNAATQLVSAQAQV